MKVEWPSFTLFGLLALLVLPSIASAADQHVALLTAIEGNIARIADDKPVPIKNLVKLRQGEVLALEDGARLQVVYFATGRLETWTGSARVEIGLGESKATGRVASATRQLPKAMVTVIARTPALDTYGRAGVTRLRNVPSPETLARIEKNYARLRAETTADDLTPEFVRLSSLFDLREFERIGQVLADLQQSHPSDTQAKLLISLFREAVFRTQNPAR